METRLELEEEIKTFKSLRRTYCKDAISGLVIAYLCGLPVAEYIQDQQIEIAIIGGVATLASMVFSCRNMFAYEDMKDDLKQARTKIKDLDNLLY